MELRDIRDFGLSEDQKMVRQMAIDFGEKEILPVIEEYEAEGRYPKDIVNKLGELGFLGPFVPPEYGGAGMDFLSYGIICETVAYYDWVCASAISVQMSLVGSGILRFGTEEQKQEFLVPLASGKKQASGSLTEPNAGTDLASLTTRAVRDGDDYILNGNKTYISHATHADILLTLATTDPALRHKGICAFLVENPSPGISTSKLPIWGMTRGDTCDVAYENVRVPAKNMLLGENRGWTVVMANLDTGRYSVACRCMGQSQYFVDQAIAYANQRETFGTLIREYQMVKAMIADMVVNTEAARLLCYRVGRLKDAGEQRTGFEAAQAKLFASDTAVKSALDCIQIHGGVGATKDYSFGHKLLEAKVLQIGEGTNQIQRRMIADYALGMLKQK